MNTLNFDKNGGLLPAIVQDARTNTVLMLGYMNAEALAITQRTGKVTFFSRSRHQLWTKGETSGNFLLLQSIATDCDADTLLIKAVPTGAVCHTGAATCFGESNDAGISFLNTLSQIIADRKRNPSVDSYTSRLFEKGILKIAQKVGEEAVETVIEAVDGSSEDKFKNECADLVFHFLVLLAAKNLSLADIAAVLATRHQ